MNNFNIICCIYDNTGDNIFKFSGLYVADLKMALSSFNDNKPIKDYLYYLKVLSNLGYRVELVFCNV